jgi:hypothetical protein
MKIIIHDTSKDKGTSIYKFGEDENKTVQSLYEEYKIDKNSTYFISNGKILKDEESLNDYNNMVIETRVRLRGGKGGFGSSLRIQQAVKKQTKNFDACRDLQGRRLRKVNQERQLNEWRLKKAEEEKLLQKYIDGYNNSEEDLFKKIMNEKRQSDALKKNQKYFEDNENLRKNIQKSFKLYLKKKRERTREKDEEDQKVQNECEEYKGKKIMKLKKIKKINNILNENEKVKEKEDIEKIKQMENEEDLFNAILA